MYVYVYICNTVVYCELKVLKRIDNGRAGTDIFGFTDWI